MTERKRLFIPDFSSVSVNDIPYDTLYGQGVRALFFDLDNTLIAYDVEALDDDIIRFLDGLRSRFFVAVISNSGEKRVHKALHGTDLYYVHSARKPFGRGLKRALGASGEDPGKTLLVGDQLMTDIFGGNRLGLMTCLVRPVKIRSDRWMTRLNRKIENLVRASIRRREPDLYGKRFLGQGDDDAL
jgi:uncharacterized protein